MAEENTKHYSLEQIEKMIAKGDYEASTNIAQEFEVAPDFWEDAEIIQPLRKKSIHLKLDEDVFEWFKSKGSGHLTRMNTILRSYYEAHK